MLLALLVLALLFIILGLTGVAKVLIWVGIAFAAVWLIGTISNRNP